jgi:hypothetical protein
MEEGKGKGGPSGNLNKRRANSGREYTATFLISILEGK